MKNSLHIFRLTCILFLSVGCDGRQKKEKLTHPGKVDQPLRLHPNARRNEAMQTVSEIPTARKPAQAYYCSYLGLSGVLTRPAVQVLFLEPASGAVITLSPEDVLRDVVVNGEVASSMAAYIADMAAGGRAAIACGREEGRN
jgi:hypothetical protein